MEDKQVVVTNAGTKFEIKKHDANTCLVTVVHGGVSIPEVPMTMAEVDSLAAALAVAKE